MPLYRGLGKIKLLIPGGLRRFLIPVPWIRAVEGGIEILGRRRIAVLMPRQKARGQGLGIGFVMILRGLAAILISDRSLGIERAPDHPGGAGISKEVATENGTL